MFGALRRKEGGRGVTWPYKGKKNQFPLTLLTGVWPLWIMVWIVILVRVGGASWGSRQSHQVFLVQWVELCGAVNRVLKAVGGATEFF